METGVSYFGNRMVKHVKEDMEDIREHNCSFVVHTFSEDDLEFYRGTIEEIVKVSHMAGLKVYLDPWGVGRVFGGETYSKFITTDLDARQVSSNGEFLPIACLNNKKFRDFVKTWAEAAIEIGADVLFWDEPHFCIYPGEENIADEPDIWACRCEVCKELFKKKTGHLMPTKLNKEAREFRQASIVDFLSNLCDLVHQKGRKNSVCILPSERPFGGIFDWSKIAEISSLDVVGTDPYWSLDEKDVAGKVKRFSRTIKGLADKYNKEGQIWILNFNIKNGTERNIEIAVDAAYEEGIRNLAAWSYFGTGQMSCLASDNPQLVWDTLGKAYKKLI